MARKSNPATALLFFLLLNILALAHASPKFTPEAMISAPRRSTAEPSPDGTLALYTVSSYSFETHKKLHELRVLDLKSGEDWLFSNASIGEAHWLGNGGRIVWLEYRGDGGTGFVVGDARAPGERPVIAGSVPGSIQDVKIAHLRNNTWAIVFDGQANPDGSLYNSVAAVTPLSSGRTYTKLFVRHWDIYITQQRNSVWYTTLSLVRTGNSQLNYSMTVPVNALKDTGLESPIPPFGSTDNFDVSRTGIAFVAKDPTLNQAATTKSDLYYIPLTNFREPVAPKPQMIMTPGFYGASTAPVFSRSGTRLVFLRQRDISYESDLFRLFHVNLARSFTANEFYATEDGLGGWDRWPSAMAWSKDDKELYVSAEEAARVKLFVMHSDPEKAKALPSPIFKEGYVSDFHLLKNSSSHDSLLVSSTSLVDNSIFSTVDLVEASSSNGTKGIKLVSSNLDGGAKYGLSRSQISETWWKGDGDYMVHSWVIKPSFWKEGETYPLAFIIHGGPQGSWADDWSTRWNLMVFAEHGYIVVAPNPTGSTGFGQTYINAIQNQWGGRPYEDLVLGFAHLSSPLFPDIDTRRAVVLGASYGGYMTYWIQGQPLGRAFKAIVTHDGSFNTLSQYSSDELWFMNHDFNGTLFDPSSLLNYQRWNPALHTANWSTPHLVIHNDLDYRLPVSEGIAAFNVLQSKGVESKFLSFPDENHWVLKPENSRVWYLTVLDWCNGHVGLPLASQGATDRGLRGTLMNGEWV